MEISYEFSEEILEEAALLKNRYGEDGMLDLLRGEQRRIAKEQSLTLSSPREIINGVIEHVSDIVLKNYGLTKAILASYVIEKIIDYLVAQNLIDPLYLSRDKFVIMLVVGLTLDKIREVWVDHREKENQQ